MTFRSPEIRLGTSLFSTTFNLAHFTNPFPAICYPPAILSLRCWCGVMASVLTLTKLEVRVRFPSPASQTCNWAEVIGQTTLLNNCMQEGASGDRGSFQFFSAYRATLLFTYCAWSKSALTLEHDRKLVHSGSCLG